METNEIIQRVIEKTGMKIEDVEKKILDKQRELSNLVSRDGAAYIVAKESGLDLLEKRGRRIEIKNVVPGIKNLNLSARIFRVFQPKEFEREGKKSSVANIILGDETGTVRLSLWDTQTKLVENLKPDMAVEISGAYTKEDGKGGTEIRLSKRGVIKTIEKSTLPSIEKVPTKEAERANISDFKEGETYELRAAMVQLFDGNFFYEVCPQCNSKIKRDKEGAKCSRHGLVTPAQNIVISGIVDDGTGNIRAVFFRDAALQLINMKLEEALNLRDSLLENVDVLGKEFVFSGRVRRNAMFNRLELIVSNVKGVDVKGEINKILNTFGSNV